MIFVLAFTYSIRHMTPTRQEMTDKEYIVAIVRQKQEWYMIENKLRSYKIQALNKEMALWKAIIDWKKLVFVNYVISMFDINELE